MSKIPKHYCSFVNACNHWQADSDHHTSLIYNALVVNILEYLGVGPISKIPGRSGRGRMFEVRVN